MEDVVITFALAYILFLAHRYWDKIFSSTTLVIGLIVTVTLDLFDWL